MPQISDLPDADPLLGPEMLGLVQGGVTKKVSIAILSTLFDYVPVPATSTTAGVVTPDGTTLTIDPQGVLHSTGGYALVPPTPYRIGGVLAGSGVAIDSFGSISTIVPPPASPTSYSTSGAISPKDEVALITGTTPLAMTLDVGVLNGHPLLLKRFGSGTVAVTALVDGSTQTLVMDSANGSDSIALVWYASLGFWLLVNRFRGI